VSDFLRDLDRRFVRSAAPRVARWVDALSLHRSTAAPGAPKAKQARDLDLRNLRSLDERYASSGALGFFREVPQLMGVVIGIVFVAGALAALKEHDSSSSSQQSVVDGSTTGTGTGTGTAGTGVLGPAVGDSVSTYLTAAARNLTAVTVNAPDDQRFALVSLGGYYRPAQIASILSGYVVKQVYLRDAGAGKDAGQFPLVIKADLVGDLKKAYARTAAAQALSRTKYQMLADTTDAGDPYKAFYQHYADVARLQATAYGSTCPCVFAAIVSATPAQLTSLRSRPGIRALEVAGRGLEVRDLDVTPLLPEVKTIVPEPAAADAPS
jgi:hypothetical protein